MYKVTKRFIDIQDENYLYNVGDIYPRKGLNVLPSRIKELSGKENRQGVPLIKEYADPKTEEPKSKIKEAEEE